MDDLFEEDLFSIFDGLDEFPPFTPLDGVSSKEVDFEATHKSCSSETELEPSLKRKRVKEEGVAEERVSHITVERNRRKQMNEHLSVLRSLMPCFYVKRGDQASIIGGVVEYINELQQILQSLEAKKQRKVVYSEVMSPSPRLSPRKPPLSPRLNWPVSPTTPQPGSPYKGRLHHLSPAASLEPSPSSSSNNSSSVLDFNINSAKELVANSKSALADVEVKFSGPNVLLKTVSPIVPGQALKIISALEDLSLEIIHVNITTLDDTMLVSSFTIKIGIECRLSAEELAQQIQLTFC